MGNGKSSEMITGDQQDTDSMIMDGQDSQELCEQALNADHAGGGDTGGYSGHEEVDLSGVGQEIDLNCGDVMDNNNMNKSNSVLDNIVETMDTSELIQVSEEATNMMMEDFSDLVGPSSNQVTVSSLNAIQADSNLNEEFITSDFPPAVGSATSQPQISTAVSKPTSIAGPTTSGRTIVMTTSGQTVQSVAASIAKSSSSQPIIIPVSSSILSSPTALSDFINSIKPPVIPGSATIVKAPPQIINIAQSAIGQQFTISPSTGTLRPVTKISTYSKKQPSIAPAPMTSGNVVNVSSLQSAINSGSIKIINTPTGQQLFFTSPIKQEGGGTKMVTIPVSSSSGTSNTGQVLFLSPMKQGTVVKSGLKTLAPAPASVKVSIAQAAGTSRPPIKQSSVQMIKLVQGTGRGMTTLRPLAPSTGGTSGPKTIQLTSAQLASLVSGTSGDFSGGKVTIVQAPSSSGGKVASGQTIQIGNQQLLIPTSMSGGSGSNSQVIMLPAHLLQGLTNSGQQFTIQTGKGIKAAMAHQTPIRTSYVPIAPSPTTSTNVHPSTKLDHVLNKQLTPTSAINVNGKLPFNAGAPSAEEPNRQKKPCNCTKSGCLKLYCDCFAQGEFCSQCNCVNCNNNLDHEEERQKAVKQCLERNPHAFHPKIGKGRTTNDNTERRHTKGCNCRRSGCLKNYCECYEAKILCSDLCKCCGCKNFEDSFERKTLQLMNIAEAADYRSSQVNVSKLINFGSNDGYFNCSKLPLSLATISERIGSSAVNYVTTEIIESTASCLMAVAADGEKKKMNSEEIEANLLKEFGRCLNKIIDWSDRNVTNGNSNHNNMAAVGSGK